MSSDTNYTPARKREYGGPMRHSSQFTPERVAKAKDIAIELTVNDESNQ